jgi:penicillin-binding protein 1A
VIIDPNSGAIRSWIGGPNYRYLPYDAARGVHTLASTFKPIVMAAALEAGYDPCQYQSAERRVYRKYNNWAPQNYNKKYEGFYSMEGTLQKSINTSTVAWYFQTGEARVKAQAKALGLTDNWPDGPSVALGTAAASPIQLALAYAAFANGGTLHEAYFIERITTTSGRVLYSREKKTGQRVLSQRTAALINSMLQTAVLSGTGSAIPLRYGAASSWAGKTGTSQSYSDAWFVAYKPDVVSVTWMGGMNPIIRFRTGGLGSGSAMALPVFGSLVKSYENKLTNADWPDLNEKWLEELDCTTYRDQNLIDRLESIFLREDDENQPLDNDVPQEEGDEKKPSSWLKRLLDKVKN